MSSSVPAVKRALVALLRELYPEAAVSYSEPAAYPGDAAHLGSVHVENAQPTEGGMRRSRRETVDTQVVLSCYRSGTVGVSGADPLADDAAVAAEAAAYAMLTALDDHFRDRQQSTLGGACMSAIVSSHDTDLGPLESDQGVIVGWVCEITAIVTTVATI